MGIIIAIFGNLGNQMFQIALYEKLRQDNKSVFVDNHILDREAEYRGLARAEKVFNLSLAHAPEKDYLFLGDTSRAFHNRVRRKLFGRRKTYVAENAQGNFQFQILQLNDAFLEGYWQSPLYFDDCRERILELFTFPKQISTSCRKYLDMINKTGMPVSIHIRRGDYLTEANSAVYGNICTEAYYLKAIDCIRQKHPEARFFVFSDDPVYAAEKYEGQDNFIVVRNTGEPWEDMLLMTRCRHNIIANSTFSWWGAWLNQNRDREVIAPKKWINTKEMKDVCPKEWIRI